MTLAESIVAESIVKDAAMVEAGTSPDVAAPSPTARRQTSSLLPDALPVRTGRARRFRSWIGRLAFMAPRDIGLFLRSARTDATLARLRPAQGNRGAFEAVYAASPDPWASASTRYTYQHRKYRTLVGLLPAGRRFSRALDLGCGVGLMSRLLVPHADEVVGMDIAQAAVGHARASHGMVESLTFQQGDVLDLPAALDGKFDLVVIADVLYYLLPLDDTALASIALRVADLIAPNGVCLLANHFFFAADADSRASRRIHRAFAACPRFRVVSEHRRPFYLATMLSGVPNGQPA